ncbi:DUF421 domain-containing protein [Bacillus marinisedimentorum]|uniref:DUF421 domain-containing protein n=1 Tax=Bacillus marinisedimentorum TaxID=1821260 RepID=UPI000871EA23|nr:DUF421 domain-containing protein [Bacillus marinisedimentorum]
MNDFLQIGTELVIGFIALFFLTKLLGKNQISQITAFDFVSAIVLGELVGNALYDNETKITKVLFAVVLWGMLIYSTELITQKFKRARSFLEGQPSILISHGKLDRQALKKNQLDINQLQHLLRSKDVFSLREVEYAILETDGSVNVLKKSAFANPTRSDMNLPEEKVILPITLITDGEVIWDNLEQSGFDKDWLQGQIQVHGAREIKDVLYAEWKEGESLHVITM